MLYANPTEHAANPPSTWTVAKVAPRRWSIFDARGHDLDTYDTRREALAAVETGFAARLYAQEGDWFAGRPVPGWKPYKEAV